MVHGFIICINSIFLQNLVQVTDFLFDTDNLIFFFLTYRHLWAVMATSAHNVLIYNHWPQRRFLVLEKKIALINKIIFFKFILGETSIFSI